MSNQPGIYQGELPPSLAFGRCTLKVGYASFDTPDDQDDKPEYRLPETAKLMLTPNLNGSILVGDMVMGVTSVTLYATNGVFDFYAIDPAHSVVIPSEWSWRATLTVDGELWARFTFNPDHTKTTDLGPLAVITTVPRPSAEEDLQVVVDHILSLKGGPAGPAPKVTWDGTRIVVDGITGPDLKGEAGLPNSLSMGTVKTLDATESATAAIVGVSPNQKLDLGIPKGVPGGWSAVRLTKTQSLNDLVAPGLYVQGDSSATTVELGYPMSGFAGQVEVYGNETMLTQRATYFNNSALRGMWYRTRYGSSAWSSWWRLDDMTTVGTGSPYNVVTPLWKGQTYIDTNQTYGAKRWMSNGLGKTSWDPVDADTGPMNMIPYLNAGWTTGKTAPICEIRRQNGNVSFEFRVSPQGAMLEQTVASGFILVDALPAGFLPKSYTLYAVCGYSAVPTHAVVNLSSRNKLNVNALYGFSNGSKWTESQMLMGSAMWNTSDPWITTF